MNTLRPELRAELNRWLEKIKDDSTVRGGKTMAIDDVLAAHFCLADYFFDEGIAFSDVGPRDFGLLSSAVSRQFVGYGSAHKWTEPMDLCATLFFGLVKNHAFHDINKRTALVVLLMHLKLIGKTPNIAQDKLESFTVAVADDSYQNNSDFDKYRNVPDPNIKYISWFLKRSTRNMKDDYRTITFNKLETIFASITNGQRLTIL